MSVPGDKNYTVNRRILSVEDHPINQELIHALLEREGVRVEDADTLHSARLRLASESFDLILLDINLPDGSGLDLVDELKRDVRTAAVPIVVVTATTVESVRETALMVGCSAVVTKPIQAVAFIDLVRRHLDGTFS